MKDIYEILHDYNITLLAVPPKGGIYTPVIEFGNKLLYCSGCGTALNDQPAITGKLGRDLTVAEGQKAAYNCMLNLLANLHKKTGDQRRITVLTKYFCRCGAAGA